MRRTAARHREHRRPPAGRLARGRRPPGPGDLPVRSPRGGGEPLGAAACLDVVRGVTGRGATERRASADTVVRSVAAGTLDDDEAATLAAVLGWAVRIETTTARVALLAALPALARRDRVAPWVLDGVLAEVPAALDEAERPLVEALIDVRRRAR